MLVEPLTGPVDPLRLAALSGDLAAVVRIDGWTVVVDRPITQARDLADLDVLAQRLDWREPSSTWPPFGSGLVGVLTDALSPGLLSLPADARPRPVALDDVWMGLRDSAVCISPEGDAFACAEDVLGLTSTTAHSRVRRWRERAEAAADPPEPATIAPRAASLSLSASQHADAVGRAQELIAAGEVYQLNLTMQVRVPWTEGGLALAERMWAASPASHAAWVALPGGPQVVSVSPETFLRSTGAQVQMRPIKGTRPRRDGVAADREQAAELRASGKDGAEHIMIVDLVRNDLGRVCRIGTVRVPELAALESHPTVWHLTSTVTGELRPDVGVAELLAATFPCGSVTGAPKRRAWQRIAELEPFQRGVYCGAIGAITRGRLDLSVAIRTAVVADGLASYGTGGGIVADSRPAAEHAEAMDKARAFLEATNAHVVRAAPALPPR